MALFEFFLVFLAVVQGCPGFSSSVIDQLKLDIEEVRNKSRHYEVLNQNLQTEIHSLEEQFRNESERLSALKESGSDEIASITEELRNLPVELDRLRGEKDLLNKLIFQEEQLLRKVQHGLKWLKQDLALVQERERNGDQSLCLELDTELVDSEEGDLQARAADNIFLEELDLEILQLELKQVTSHLNRVRRLNEELMLNLSHANLVVSKKITGQREHVGEVISDLKQARVIQKRFKMDWTVSKNEVEQLQVVLDKLKELVEEVRAEASQVADELKYYERAISCYAKLQTEAVINVDDDVLPLEELGPETGSVDLLDPSEETDRTSTDYFWPEPVTTQDDLKPETTVGIFPSYIEDDIFTTEAVSTYDIKQEPATYDTLSTYDLDIETVSNEALSTDILGLNSITPQSTDFLDNLGYLGPVTNEELSTDVLRPNPVTPQSTDFLDNLGYLGPVTNEELSTDVLRPNPVTPHSNDFLDSLGLKPVTNEELPTGVLRSNSVTPPSTDFSYNLGYLGLKQVANGELSTNVLRPNPVTHGAPKTDFLDGFRNFKLKPFTKNKLSTGPKMRPFTFRPKVIKNNINRPTPIKILI